MRGFRFAIAGLATAFAGAAFPGQVSAEEIPAPDLTGVWIGSYKTLRWNGDAEGVLQLRVVAQEGPNLKVEKSWKLEPGATLGDVHGELLTEAVEPLIGVIGFDGRDIHLAEEGDGGVYTGRLVGTDTLELVYVEAGVQATAYRTVLTRTK